MPRKTDSELALAEKKDLARTLVRWKYRSKANRDLNEIETAVIESHEDEKGNYTAIDADALINALSGRKALEGGAS